MSVGDATETGETRRDFLYLATGTTAAVGTGLAMWPFIDSMNPGADIRAVSSVEIDVSPIELGQRITVKWQGKPVFINHRTPDEIERAKADDAADLIDPALDAERVQREEWLVVIGICTHLGCVPLGQKAGDPRGEYGGYFCACHGSAYDTSGRVRRRPAPRNLDVPPHDAARSIGRGRHDGPDGVSPDPGRLGGERSAPWVDARAKGKRGAGA
jgi:ubiquinol-cytochrome c reductase iron-sulfur subunit